MSLSCSPVVSDTSIPDDSDSSQHSSSHRKESCADDDETAIPQPVKEVGTGATADSSILPCTALKEQMVPFKSADVLEVQGLKRKVQGQGSKRKAFQKMTTVGTTRTKHFAAAAVEPVPATVPTYEVVSFSSQQQHQHQQQQLSSHHEILLCHHEMLWSVMFQRLQQYGERMGRFDALLLHSNNDNNKNHPWFQSRHETAISVVAMSALGNKSYLCLVQWAHAQLKEVLLYRSGTKWMGHLRRQRVFKLLTIGFPGQYIATSVHPSITPQSQLSSSVGPAGTPKPPPSITPLEVPQVKMQNHPMPSVHNHAESMHIHTHPHAAISTSKATGGLNLDEWDIHFLRCNDDKTKNRGIDQVSRHQLQLWVQKFYGEYNQILMRKRSPRIVQPPTRTTLDEKLMISFRFNLLDLSGIFETDKYSMQPISARGARNINSSSFKASSPSPLALEHCS